MYLENINYLAVIVAAIAAFALGSLWYTNILFGKAWQKEVGLTDEKIKNSNMAKTMIFSFIIMVVMSFGMALLIQGHEDKVINWVSGLFHGLLVGVFFSAASIGINYLYQLKSFRLWLIDAFYQIIFLGIIGTILGAWH